MHLQCLPIKKNTGARGTLTTLYQTLCIWLFGCLLALYGSTMHLARLWWFSDHFFSCLVCGPLEKKKTTFSNCLKSDLFALILQNKQETKMALSMFYDTIVLPRVCIFSNIALCLCVRMYMYMQVHNSQIVNNTPQTVSVFANPLQFRQWTTPFGDQTLANSSAQAVVRIIHCMSMIANENGTTIYNNTYYRKLGNFRS